jgi:hypothetical protein
MESENTNNKKDWWTLREDLTAAQRKNLEQEWDTKGFSPGLEKLLLKVTKGNKDKNGVPDFSKTTLCDIVSLNLEDFGNLLQTISDANYTERDEEFIHSDYQIRGWNAFENKVNDIQDAFDKAFGDALMGGSKSSVINIFRAMQSCSNKGDWATPVSGSLYRGKKISWEQFKKMPWRFVSGNEVLKCTATYQSKLAMQSWTTDPKVALNFSGTQGAQSHYDLNVPELYTDTDGLSLTYGKNITGFLPVVIEANVPMKDRFLNPNLINTLQKKIGHAGLREKEVLRLSTEPIKATFTVTKSMLEKVVEEKGQVEHIFNIIKNRK